MATKKKVTPGQRHSISKAISGIESKLVENYNGIARMSGNDWKKESSKYKQKVKKNVAAAKRKIEAEVRKNPAGATVAAAILGAIAGAIIMSKLKKK